MNINGQTFLDVGTLIEKDCESINECINSIVADLKKYISMNDDISNSITTISNVSNSCDAASNLTECYSIVADTANRIGQIYDSVEV